MIATDVNKKPRGGGGWKQNLNAPELKNEKREKELVGKKWLDFCKWKIPYSGLALRCLMMR